MLAHSQFESVSRIGRRLVCRGLCASSALASTLIAISLNAAEPEAQKVDPSAAIESIAAVDARIENIEWKVSLHVGELSDVDGRWSLAHPGPERFDARVRVDRSSDRYFAEGNALQRIFDNDNPNRLLESQLGSSWDGKRFRQWQRSAEPAIGQLPHGEGIIDRDSSRLNDAAFKKSYWSWAGADWMPPAFHVGPEEGNVPRLSSFLHKQLTAGKPLTVIRSGRSWIITTASALPGRYPVSTEIHWDIDKGAIAEQIWYYALPGKREILEHIKLKLQPVNDQIWVPAEVLLVDFNPPNITAPPNRRAVRWEFSDVAVNRQLQEGDFEISFPADVRVSDYTGENQ